MKQIVNKKEMNITKMLLSSNAILKPKKNFLRKKKKKAEQREKRNLTPLQVGEGQGSL